jgi:proline iminopeptidase
MVQGRLDIGAPIAWAWDLSNVWPRAKLVVVHDAGHAGDHPGIAQELVRATDRFGTVP